MITRLLLRCARVLVRCGVQGGTLDIDPHRMIYNGREVLFASVQWVGLGSEPNYFRRSFVRRGLQFLGGCLVLMTFQLLGTRLEATSTTRPGFLAAACLVSLGVTLWVCSRNLPRVEVQFRRKQDSSVSCIPVRGILRAVVLVATIKLLVITGSPKKGMSGA